MPAITKTTYRGATFRGCRPYPKSGEIYLDFRTLAGQYVTVALPIVGTAEAVALAAAVNNALLGPILNPRGTQNGAPNPEIAPPVGVVAENAPQSRGNAPAHTPKTRGGNPIVITTAKPQAAVWTDDLCSICGERQFWAPDGVTGCVNGHRGASPKGVITRLRMPKREKSKVEQFLEGASAANVAESTRRAKGPGVTERMAGMIREAAEKAKEILK